MGRRSWAVLAAVLVSAAVLAFLFRDRRGGLPPSESPPLAGKLNLLYHDFEDGSVSLHVVVYDGENPADAVAAMKQFVGRPVTFYVVGR